MQKQNVASSHESTCARHTTVVFPLFSCTYVNAVALHKHRTFAKIFSIIKPLAAFPGGFCVKVQEKHSSMFLKKDGEISCWRGCYQ